MFAEALPRIFVSSQDIDGVHTTKLIRKLRSAHFQVEHSPRNPLNGEDSRWANWYNRGLTEALDLTDICINVIDFVWDSSTWMFIEADEALQRLNQGQIQCLYYYNPDHIQVAAVGAKKYLKERLPDKLDEVIEVLKKV